MGINKSGSALFKLWLLIATMTLPSSAYAQSRLPEQVLDQWFYSRLLWGVVIAGIIGVTVGVMHLCRLRFEVGELQVNRQARRKLILYLVALMVVAGSFLLLDAWQLYRFGKTSLTLSQAVDEVWLNYRNFIVWASMLIAFALMVVITTRLKSDCRCRFAFIPGASPK